jgi:hypothetical protein
MDDNHMADDLQTALEEALENNPRSDELKEMIRALKRKRKGYLLDLSTAEEERKSSLKAAISDMDRQIHVLKEELAITQFVEYEVKSAVLKAQADENPYL